METNRTNKTVLMKGVKLLLIALVCIFTGPILLTLALSDKDNAVYIPILIIGCLISLTAILLIFKGIKTVMDSMFSKK